LLKNEMEPVTFHSGVVQFPQHSGPCRSFPLLEVALRRAKIEALRVQRTSVGRLKAVDNRYRLRLEKPTS
jgi:hypothetical protein